MSSSYNRANTSLSHNSHVSANLDQNSEASIWRLVLFSSASSIGSVRWRSTEFFVPSFLLMFVVVLALIMSLVPRDTRAAACTSNGTGGGVWSLGTTWSGCTGAGGVPAAADTITILNGDTVSINTAATVADITIGQGTTGVLEFEQSNARTLTVTGSVTVVAGGTLRSNPAGTVTTHVLSLSGDLTNNGTLDFSTNANTAGASITFTGAANNTFSGTGATTDIRTITINKGTSPASTLEITTSNFSVRGATTDSTSANFLNPLLNGTLKVSGTFTANFRTFDVAGYAIPATAGFWLNNPNYTVTAQNGGPNLTGLLRISAGTYNVGTTNNSFTWSNNSVFTMEGGTMNIAARFAPAAANSTNSLTFTMNGGTLTTSMGSAVTPNASGTIASFDIPASGASSSFTMSGGTIIMQKVASGIDYRMSAAGTINISGGTVQFGNALTTGSPVFVVGAPAGATNLFPGLAVNATATLAVTLNTAATVRGNVTIAPGTTLNANGQGLTVSGNSVTNPGNWTNGGIFTSGTQTTMFNSAFGTQAIGGISATSFSGLTINNSAGLTLTNSATVNSTLILTNGMISTGANMLTVGSTGTISGGSSSSHVVGTLKKNAVPNGNFVFPVGVAAVAGHAAGYTPLDLENTSGGGDLTVSTNHAVQSLLAAGTSLHEYWSLTEAGSIVSDLTFHYLETDVNGSEANYRIVVVEGGNATSFPNDADHTFDGGTNSFFINDVQSFSDWTAAEPLTPTAVKLTAFTAIQNDGEVMLQWRTGYEAQNLGYVVYREQDGKRVAITPSLVAGSALLAGGNTKLTSGLTYTWYDQVPEVGEQRSEVRDQKSAIRQKTDPGVTYWLEDVDLNGTRTLHGPIAPVPVVALAAKGGKLQRADLINELCTKAMGASSMRSPVTGVEFSSWLAGFETQDLQQTALSPQLKIFDPDAGAMQRRIESQPGIKIAVNKDGWYRITQPELIAAGYDPTTNASQLQLYTNGVVVPIKQSGDQVHLTPSDYIEFYGYGLESPTETARTYYLVVDSNHFGTRIGDLDYRDPQRLPPPSSANSFDYTVERRERMIYFSSLRNGDTENFFGQIVSTTPVVATMPVTNPDSGGEGTLEVVLQGVTGQAHLVQVSFNGNELGTMSFADTEHPTGTFTIPALALQSGDNTVQLKALGGATDVSLIDTVRLTYGHTYAADNNALAISVASRETNRIMGFTGNNIRVVDITDQARALELTETAQVNEEANGTYSVDVQVKDANFRKPHTLFVFADIAAASAVSVKHNEPSSWWSQTAGADYMMITTRELKAGIEPLAQLRRNRGQVVQVIDIEDIYDEFSFGQHTPQAIHDLLQTANSTWARKPHYLLLVGDASYDPKNYFGQGLNDLVPTKLIDTLLMEAASDDWLADFNGDGLADLALGRLPVRTAADLNLMVSKIIGYENTAPDPARGALLVADTSFETPSNAIGSLLPADMPVTKVNRGSTDDAMARAQILAGLNQGPRVVNYFGHGSNGVWTGASLLSSDDAPGLTNTTRLSLYTMMTCFNGFFQDAWNDSLSEALLKSQGGAVAVWASTTLTDPSGQKVIDQEFYHQLFGVQRATLGDASRAAKSTTSDPDVRRTWTLFGDPAMRLR